jgi:hypothetical protein
MGSVVLRLLSRATCALSILFGLSCAGPRKASVPADPAEPAPAASSGDSQSGTATASQSAAASATPALVDAAAAPGSAAPEAALAASASAAPDASLRDGAGAPLPQTEDRPSAQSAAFLRRMELLVRAIEADDAKLAHDAFFPLVAYEQVKAIAKPALDHEKRLLAAFARNVHEYRRELGRDAEGVRFLRVEVPDEKVKWMKVGAEGNRVGYFRVLRSRLVVATAAGKEKSFELTSMISWRGEWYVVHLHGFK